MKVNSSSSEPNQNLLGDRLCIFIAAVTKLPLTGWLKIKHILISCYCQFYWVTIRMSAKVKVQSGLVPSRGCEEKIPFSYLFQVIVATCISQFIASFPNHMTPISASILNPFSFSVAQSSSVSLLQDDIQGPSNNSGQHILI